MYLLITRPRHDTATNYLFHWSGKILKVADSKAIQVIDLSKSKANRKKVQGYLRNNKADLVVFNGHGNDSVVAGHEDEPLLCVDENLDFLKSKTLFVRACRAAKVLGPKAVSSGASSFIGYKENFVFLHQSGKNSDFFRKPLLDELARPFMECSNQVAISLVKGHAPKIANEMSLEAYKRELNAMFVSDAESYSLPYLVSNMMNQVCIE